MAVSGFGLFELAKSYVHMYISHNSMIKNSKDGEQGTAFKHNS